MNTKIDNCRIPLLRLPVRLAVVALGWVFLNGAAQAGWNDNGRHDAVDRCGKVTEVRVRAGWWIDGVQLVCGSHVQPLRGGAGGGLYVFRLMPGEYITGFSGRENGPAGRYVYALQIHTNLRSSPIYGENGPDRGRNAFYRPVVDGQRFAGISTRSGLYLEAIDVQSAPVHSWPARFGYFHDECRDIAAVRIRAGWWIDAVQLECRDNLRPQRGGSGGNEHVFRLRPGEFITGISGTRNGPDGDYVYSIRIHTNLRTSPVFGNGGPGRGRERFRFFATPGERITGIDGRSARYLGFVEPVLSQGRGHDDRTRPPRRYDGRPVVRSRNERPGYYSHQLAYGRD